MARKRQHVGSIRQCSFRVTSRAGKTMWEGYCLGCRWKSDPCDDMATATDLATAHAAGDEEDGSDRRGS